MRSSIGVPGHWIYRDSLMLPSFFSKHVPRNSMTVIAIQVGLKSVERYSKNKPYTPYITGPRKPKWKQCHFTWPFQCLPFWSQTYWSGTTWAQKPKIMCLLFTFFVSLHACDLLFFLWPPLRFQHFYVSRDIALFLDKSTSWNVPCDSLNIDEHLHDSVCPGNLHCIEHCCETCFFHTIW